MSPTVSLVSIIWLINAITNPSVALVLIRGRHLLNPPSLPAPTLTLGPIFGPICNVIGLAFTAFTTVLFLFPPDLPVTGENMNYAVVVFGVICESQNQYMGVPDLSVIVAMITWIVQGRKHFVGPRDLGALLELARSELASEQEKVMIPGAKNSVVEQTGA
jgi:choline transport protein